MDQAGPSAATREEGAVEKSRNGADAVRKRKRSSSTESSSSSSSSTSSSSSSINRTNRNNRRRRKYKSKRKRDSSKLNKLLTEVSNLKYELSRRQTSTPREFYQEECSSYVDPNISGDLFEEEANEHPLPPSSTVDAGTCCDNTFSLSIGTKLKEPSVPHASSAFLDQLTILQRFGLSDWNSVRYADVQKLYVHEPGFTNLEHNDEIKRYDTSKFTAQMEKAFSGITYALLKQRDVMQNEMRSFLLWAQQSEQLNHANIVEKITEIFTKGEYPKITSDIFQLVCGHRAELVQYRREAIIASVKDPYHKSALRKIPPTCSHLFDSDKFTTVLEKAGGVKSVFWPKNKDRTNSAPQNDPGPSQRPSTSYGPPSKTSQAPKRENKPAFKRNYRDQNHQSFRGKGGRRGGHNEGHKGRRANSPSSRRDRREQNKRKY